MEKGEAFGLATDADSLLYNGAYYVAEFKPQERRLLVKNELGWDAENVFIDSINYIYNAEAGTVAPQMYLDGAVSEADIDSATAADWLNDPVKADFIRPVRHDGVYSYFYGFNFDPNFDPIFEPENWLLAANNENFRKSIYHGMDRVKAQKVLEPDIPESITFNSITPPDFLSLGGMDYTQMGALGLITAQRMGTFNEELALSYRDKAVEELTAAGATFPVKVLMPFNSGSTTWGEMCQIVKQQLEGLFGPDYIEICIEAFPSSGFLNATRRSGNYALQWLNWGADYADPVTFAEPFFQGNNYNFMYKETGLTQEEGGVRIVDTYYDLAAKGKAIINDTQARYLAFAEAEAYLIDRAVVIPMGFGGGGYVAARINPFEGQFSPFGVSNYRYKGQHLLDHPMNTDEFFEEYDKWLEERAALGR